MSKWTKKALAVVALGVVAGVLVPGSANAATHKHKAVVKQIVIADENGGGPQLLTPLTLGWGE